MLQHVLENFDALFELRGVLLLRCQCIFWEYKRQSSQPYQIKQEAFKIHCITKDPATSMYIEDEREVIFGIFWLVEESLDVSMRSLDQVF